MSTKETIHIKFATLYFKIYGVICELISFCILPWVCT
eukprot:UN15268